MIALISATWDEITLLKRDVQVTEEGSNGDLEYRIGELSRQPILLAVAGVGIRRARTGTSFIIQKFKPRILISAGFGGALSPDLKVGDIVVGESVISLRKNEKKELFSDLPFSKIEYNKGALLTESRFINKPEEKKRLFKASNALVVDMETWGVVEAALQSGIPVASVRSVSDESHEELPDMGAIYGNNGEVDIDKASAYFLSDPSLIAPYFKFRFKNSPRASQSLSKFLSSLIPNL